MISRQLLTLSTLVLVGSTLGAQITGVPCSPSLEDRAGGPCLEASSIPALGRLFPLSNDFFIDAATGYVGLGTIFPSSKLSVAELGGPPFSIALRVANDSFGAAIEARGQGNGSGVRAFCASGAGTGVSGSADDGLGSGFLFGSGVSGSTALSAPPFGPTAGVFGEARNPAGEDHGVYGLTRSETTGVGVLGVHSAATGSGPGVEGRTDSTDDEAYGVLGTVGAAIPGDFAAGVRGSNVGTGTRGAGVIGTHAGEGIGVFGFTAGRGDGVVGSTTGGNGVHGITAGGGFGVFSTGNFGATGTKSFVQPHPTDATREVRFVCLEGNESGTYFRGSGRLRGGRARIAVPEEFRLVTEDEGVTVQLTPRGDARLWVETAGLDEVVVRGSADVRFDYFVNGVRRGFAQFEPIQANRAFVPTVRDQPFGAELPEEARRLLVENGTLEADYTPNEATARRNGWPLREPKGSLADRPAGARLLPVTSSDR